MRMSDFETMAITAMVCLTIVTCAGFLTKCDHTKINITCDMENDKCAEIFEKAEARR